VRDPFERLVPGYQLNRDPERSPMRWDTSPNAGFTSGEPWLPMGDDVAEYNVHTEQHDPASFLSLYRAILSLRKSHLALRAGGYDPLTPQGSVLMYLRRTDEERFLIAANLSDEAADVKLDAPAELLLSSFLDQPRIVRRTLRLRANEAVVLKTAAKRSGGAKTAKRRHQEPLAHLIRTARKSR
jgi:alpha-glucosidase